MTDRTYIRSRTMSVHLQSYKNNDFRDSGALERLSLEDLKSHAIQNARETSKTLNNCIKIAGETKEGASETLVTLHHQGEQVTRTHSLTAEIDYHLNSAEKVMGGLRSIFSKTWKLKKNPAITGPVTSTVQRWDKYLEHKAKMSSASEGCTSPAETTNTLQKVEVEKMKQDDALPDLSVVLEELKDMAIAMGSELDRQNKALYPALDDVDELNFRLKSANRRTGRLMGRH